MMLEGQKVLVMRHGESLEDVDKQAYARIADEDMPLTNNGIAQAEKVGSWIHEEIGASTPLRIFASPSKRVMHTAAIITSCLPLGTALPLVVEPLIAKQNWGHVTVNNREQIEGERYRAGVLRYQFPGGENGPQMLSRFALFAQKLSARPLEHKSTLIITHGFEFRVVLKVLLGWTEEYFESLAHPGHCEIKRLLYQGQSFTLLDEMRTHDPSKNPNFIRRESSK